MKIKIPKPYIFVGTLATAGIIIGVTYNIIQANNDSVETSSTNKNDKTEQIQTVDYSNEIEDLKQRLIVAEEKIQTLEQEIETSKEEDNTNKDDIISDLQTKLSSLNGENNSRKEQINSLKKEIETTQGDLKKVKDVLKKRSKRLSEIQARLGETAKIYPSHIDMEKISNEIALLEKKEQSEENISKIEKLKKELRK